MAKEKKIADLSNDTINVQQYYERKFIKGQIDELKLRLTSLNGGFLAIAEEKGVDILRFGKGLGLQRSVSYVSRFQKAKLEKKYPGLYDKCKVVDTNPTIKLLETKKVNF